MSYSDRSNVHSSVSSYLLLSSPNLLTWNKVHVKLVLEHLHSAKKRTSRYYDKHFEVYASFLLGEDSRDGQYTLVTG